MKTVSEILDELRNAKTKEDRIAIIRFNWNWCLECVLRGTFDPRIEYDIKEPVKFTAAPVPTGYAYTNMTQALKKVYLFETKHPENPKIPLARKNILLTQLLEGMEAKEANVYQNMLLKNLRVKGLTYDLVREAVPNLIV